MGRSLAEDSFVPDRPLWSHSARPGVEGREFGAKLHDASELRAVGDYEIEARVGRVDALASRDDARAFIDYCRKLLRDRSSPSKG
jgi:hypothetical protein